jgi:hypothetical protein
MRLYEIDEAGLKKQILARINQSGLQMVPFRLRDNSVSPIVYWSQRFFALVKLGTVNMPFYLSSGEGGKKNVPAGKWYPFFGIGADGWLNKSSEQDIVAYYNSPMLKKVSQQLDQITGDLRPYTNVFPLINSTTLLDMVNKDLNPLTYDSPEDVSKNITDTIAKIQGQNTQQNTQNTVQPQLVKPIIDKLIQDYAGRKIAWNDMIKQIEDLIKKRPDIKDKIVSYFNSHPSIKSYIKNS